MPARTTQGHTCGLAFLLKASSGTAQVELMLWAGIGLQARFGASPYPLTLSLTLGLDLSWDLPHMASPLRTMEPTPLTMPPHGRLQPPQQGKCEKCVSYPWPVAHQTSLSMGFPRQEYWSGLPFPSPGDLPDPGVKPLSLTSPTLAMDSLPVWAIGEGQIKSQPLFTLDAAETASGLSLPSNPGCSPTSTTCPHLAPSQRTLYLPDVVNQQEWSEPSAESSLYPLALAGKHLLPLHLHSSPPLPLLLFTSNLKKF